MPQRSTLESHPRPLHVIEANARWINNLNQPLSSGILPTKNVGFSTVQYHPISPREPVAGETFELAPYAGLNEPEMQTFFQIESIKQVPQWLDTSKYATEPAFRVGEEKQVQDQYVANIKAEVLQLEISQPDFWSGLTQDANSHDPNGAGEATSNTDLGHLLS